MMNDKFTRKSKNINKCGCHDMEDMSSMDHMHPMGMGHDPMQPMHQCPMMQMGGYMDLMEDTEDMDDMCDDMHMGMPMMQMGHHMDHTNCMCAHMMGGICPMPIAPMNPYMMGNYPMNFMETYPMMQSMKPMMQSMNPMMEGMSPMMGDMSPMMDTMRDMENPMPYMMNMKDFDDVDEEEKEEGEEEEESNNMNEFIQNGAYDVKMRTVDMSDIED